jgi:hypothetical protein
MRVQAEFFIWTRPAAALHRIHLDDFSSEFTRPRRHFGESSQSQPAGVHQGLQGGDFPLYSDHGASTTV